MKIKHLLVVIAGLVVLLLYFMGCYKLVNKSIDINTSSQIHSYFRTMLGDKGFSYDYLLATMNDDETINVYVKLKGDLDDTYCFVFRHSGGYHLIRVNQDIPIYIK